MKYLNQKGVSLIELMVGLGLMGALGYATIHFTELMRKETTAVTEDLTTMIEKFGASKIITRDLAAAEGSFNYINIADDNQRPFFVLAKNLQCDSPTCSRTLTLSIPPGQTRSRYFYMLVKRPVGREITKFTVLPRHVFNDTTKQYAGINWRSNDPNYSLHKRAEFPDSPWDRGRLLLLSSELDFYDCFSDINAMFNTLTCDLSLVAKRPYRLLGVVNQNLKDMTYYQVENEPDLLKTSYKVCRPNSNNSCASIIQPAGGIVTPQTFFEKLPYMPGADNRASLAPVELVRYHLEKPGPNFPEHTIRFHRSTATLVGNKLKFQDSRILMTGLQSLIFTRTNVSSPIVEYKMIKARARKSVR